MPQGQAARYGVEEDGTPTRADGRPKDPQEKAGAPRVRVLAFTVAALLAALSLAPGTAHAQISTTDDSGGAAESTGSSSDSSSEGGLEPSSISDTVDEATDADVDSLLGPSSDSSSSSSSGSSSDATEETLPEASPGGSLPEGTTTSEATSSSGDQYGADQLVATGGSGTYGWVLFPALGAALVAATVIALLVGPGPRRSRRAPARRHRA